MNPEAIYFAIFGIIFLVALVAGYVDSARNEEFHSSALKYLREKKHGTEGNRPPH